MKRILITGVGSYIGSSVERWLRQAPGEYEIDTIDMKGEQWRNCDFSQYQVVFHVAGIVHMGIGHSAASAGDIYYSVNTELAVETAQRAKEAGVGQFVFMSSMSVYGNADHITRDTAPDPKNYYGDSKWKAEQGLEQLSDAAFRIAILRPPMVYGKGAKGNYPTLSKLARRMVVFPRVKNRRSMIYIENLCEFIRLIIDNRERGVFFPQDGQWVNTSDMVQKIAAVWNHPIWITSLLAPAVWLGCRTPGKIGILCRKAFGDCYYDMEMSNYKDEYRVCNLEAAIEQTER